MVDFYINARPYGNSILYSGFRNGERIYKKFKYTPKLFTPTNEPSKYKTLFGGNLKEINFDSIKDAKEFIKKYESVDNFEIFGNSKFEYCFIDELFPNKVEWDFSKLRILIIDIEVDSDPETGGFASIENPFQPIISIAFKIFKDNKKYLLGYDDFDAPDDVIYIKCKDEYTLLKKFVQIFSDNYPDAISGWNSEGFDIPYLMGRCKKILDAQDVNKISPWKVVYETKKKEFNEKFGRYEEKVSYNIMGIPSLDYQILYMKYHPEGMKREFHSLDFISKLETGFSKVEYEGSLHQFYLTNRQKFYEYNIQDVDLIEKIDDVCKLYELAFALAYDSKVNFDDIFNQTRMGDALCYSSLKKKNIQVPHKNNNIASEYKGGYVKAPIVGLYKWAVSVDATSLYPSLINGFNISPETLIQKNDYSKGMHDIISKGVSVESILQKKINLESLKQDKVCLAPNGQFFKTDKRGFIPEIVENLFNERKQYKKIMIDYEKELEKIDKEKNPAEYNRLKNLISKYNSLQTAKKLVANSIYGALGNVYFRFYDVRLAEAITLSGQLANQWTALHVNRYFNNLLKTDKDYVIYMDTDSMFLSFQDLVEKIVPKGYDLNKTATIVLKMVTEKIQPEIDKFCMLLKEELNMPKHTISYKLEKICVAGAFPEKKRYILLVYINEGVFYTVPKLKITGYMSKEIPAISREMLKVCYRNILENNLDELLKNVEKFKTDFMCMNPDVIARVISVNGLNTYYDPVTLYKKGTPKQVKGALVYNKILEDKGLNKEYISIKDGDKVKCIDLVVPNPIKSDVISFTGKLIKELDIAQYIDYNEMYEKMFLSKLKLITDKIGIEVERRFSLEDFF